MKLVCADRLVAQHKRCWKTHRSLFEPVHYLALLERNAFIHAPSECAGLHVVQHIFNASGWAIERLFLEDYQISLHLVWPPGIMAGLGYPA